MPRLASTPPSITVALQPKRPTRMLHKGPVGRGQPAGGSGMTRSEGGGQWVWEGLPAGTSRWLNGHKPRNIQTWVPSPALPQTGFGPSNANPSLCCSFLPQRLRGQTG